MNPRASDFHFPLRRQWYHRVVRPCLRRAKARVWRTMRLYELIKLKRDGNSLDNREISDLLHAYVRDEVADYQMAALLMAIFFRGMSPKELGGWTAAMVHTGQTLDLSALPGVKVDKHSTGGVGDKVSLCLAPLVAACGVIVP